MTVLHKAWCNAITLPDDEFYDLDPPYATGRWSIPGPGEDFPVSYDHEGRCSSFGAGFRRPVTHSPVNSGSGSPASILSPPRSHGGLTPRVEGAVTTPMTKLAIDSPNDPREETSHGFSPSSLKTATALVPATPQTPASEMPSRSRHVSSSSDSSEAEADDRTFTVLRIKHMPYQMSTHMRSGPSRCQALERRV